jgi:hypothetical protein
MRELHEAIAREPDWASLATIIRRLNLNRSDPYTRHILMAWHVRSKLLSCGAVQERKRCIQTAHYSVQQGIAGDYEIYPCGSRSPLTTLDFLGKIDGLPAAVKAKASGYSTGRRTSNRPSQGGVKGIVRQGYVDLIKDVMSEHYGGESRLFYGIAIPYPDGHQPKVDEFLSRTDIAAAAFTLYGTAARIRRDCEQKLGVGTEVPRRRAIAHR